MERPDRLPLGRPGERPQGFGALAGVPSASKSAEKDRRTRHGVSCPVSRCRSQGRRRSTATPRASLNCM